MMIKKSVFFALLCAFYSMNVSGSSVRDDLSSNDYREAYIKKYGKDAHDQLESRVFNFVEKSAHLSEDYVQRKVRELFDEAYNGLVLTPDSNPVEGCIR